MNGKRRVLVLCTGNSCRSQMAEGLWRTLGHGEWESCSAGSHPSGYVHPLAVEAMRDRGIDIAAGRSKSVEGFRGEPFDVAVTVCDNARESCPVFPGASLYLHWPFDDPAQASGTDVEKIAVFVRVRNEIEAQIRRFLIEFKTALPIREKEGIAMQPIFQETNDRGDPMWAAIRREAKEEYQRGSCLCLFLNKSVLEPPCLEDALAGILSGKLATETVGEDRMTALTLKAFTASSTIRGAIRSDLQAIVDRDPVAKGYLEPFVFFKGFQALQAYRVAHWHWNHGDRFLAVFLQNRISEIYAVDIHPAARIGSGILMDHATGIVVGETSVIENNVSILHEVTLGGTGKETGDRHPKVRQGVLIGAGSKILGNVEIGEGAKIGAGSVVLDAVPPHCTVAGVPARIVARNNSTSPAMEMDQQFPHHFVDGSGI